MLILTGGGLNGSEAIAFDSAGNAWVSNLSGKTLSEFNNGGFPVSGNGYVQRLLYALHSTP